MTPRSSIQPSQKGARATRSATDLAPAEPGLESVRKSATQARQEKRALRVPVTDREFNRPR